MSEYVSPAPVPAKNSFVRRKIDVTIKLGAGSFGASGNNTLTLSGLRVSARISKQGAVYQGALDLRIYGMTPSDMNQLSQLPGQPRAVSEFDLVTIQAGDDVSGMALAYEGTILDAHTEYRGSPDVFFSVQGLGAMKDALKPVHPGSYAGRTDAATILSDLATVMGKNFENSGVSGVMLTNQYNPGTALDQANAVAVAANINMVIDDNTLAIWPKGKARGGVVALINAASGMVGYPVRNQVGVDLVTVYNPQIRYGAKVQVESVVAKTSGTYYVKGIDHTLDAETPGGQWFTSLSCSKFPVGNRPTS